MNMHAVSLDNRTSGLMTPNEGGRGDLEKRLLRLAFLFFIAFLPCAEGFANITVNGEQAAEIIRGLPRIRNAEFLLFRNLGDPVRLTFADERIGDVGYEKWLLIVAPVMGHELQYQYLVAQKNCYPKSFMLTHEKGKVFTKISALKNYQDICSENWASDIDVGFVNQNWSVLWFGNEFDISEIIKLKPTVVLVGFGSANELDVPSPEKIEQESRAIKERIAREKRDEEELIRQREAARIEAERTERQMREAELERIAREGDDSPDDHACQRKGLHPSTPPYLKCRESILAAREAREKAAESARIQREADAARKAKEEAQRLREEAARKAEEVRKQREVQYEVERRQREAQAEVTRRAAEEKALAPRMPFEVAKQKCGELGFTPGTEKFGTCVLQLTK